MRFVCIAKNPIKVLNDIQTTLRTLGRNEARIVLSFREQGRGVVTVADVISLLGNRGTTRKVIHNLLRKGWLTRLKRGR